MLFNHGFPDASVALGLIKDCLLTAADHLTPISVDVLDRLKRDNDYLAKITPLPRARICLIRSEVKECLTVITMGPLLALGSPLDKVGYIQKQLSRYTYTFPKAKLANAPNSLVMRSRPYRNDRIINAIRALYFAGGAKSFARRFQYLFPTYEAREGDQVYEVPIPMVALVATALYAALYEWRTGEQKVTEFSANAYMDVYNGHVNTLKYIRERREGAFHLMMADIYTQANTPLVTEPVSALPIAELDLDDIDGIDG
ncbi:hypothetical protein EI94DRAFT_1724597 [Lactarius quietus]|nr:hypothetical protein EI94DRAFT_1724597 [Lactarius quietus]